MNVALLVLPHGTQGSDGDQEYTYFSLITLGGQHLFMTSSDTNAGIVNMMGQDVRVDRCEC